MIDTVNMGSAWYYSQLFVTPEYPTKSFAGQTVIVTGSNVGLGCEAARHFARLNAARVILAVRNLPAGKKAKHSIEASTNRPGICEVWQLDLASYDSVKHFAVRASELPRLDVVVENAAIATSNFSLTEGHERTITVNVISTFLLGILLLPKLKATAKEFPTSSPHLTIVTSEVHGWTRFPEWQAENLFAALDDEKATNMVERYATSKLLEIFAVREIAPRISDSGVILNMLNPGLCHSELARDSGWILWFTKMMFARSTEIGSRTLIAGAAAGLESHSKYMTNGIVANDMLSSFVTSVRGCQVQAKVWRDLSAILESIQPGIMASF
jgi:NAD(P)-dependent dehydrogenase (short-subunit alcohol dehydrogenase family)